MVKKRFQVDGMKCVGCTMVVEGALEDLQGVKSASANYAKQYADVEYDETKVSEQDFAEAIAEAGYALILPPQA